MAWYTRFSTTYWDATYTGGYMQFPTTTNYFTTTARVVTGGVRTQWWDKVRITFDNVPDNCHIYVRLRTSGNDNVLARDIVSGTEYILNWANSDIGDELRYAAFYIHDLYHEAYIDDVSPIARITNIEFYLNELVTIVIGDTYHAQSSNTVEFPLDSHSVYNAHISDSISLITSDTTLYVYPTNSQIYVFDTNAVVVFHYNLIFDNDLSHITTVTGDLVTVKPVADMSDIRAFQCLTWTPGSTHGGNINVDAEVPDNVELFNNIFSDVADGVRVSGAVDYRKIFIKNTSVLGTWETVKAWIVSNTTSADDSIAIALGTATDVQTDAVGYTFVQPTAITHADVLSLGNLLCGTAVAIWIRRTIVSSAKVYASDQFRLAVGR